MIVVVVYYFRHDADPQIGDLDAMLPLHYAVQNKHTHVLDIMLQFPKTLTVKTRLSICFNHLQLCCAHDPINLKEINA